MKRRDRREYLVPWFPACFGDASFTLRSGPPPNERRPSTEYRILITDLTGCWRSRPRKVSSNLLLTTYCYSKQEQLVATFLGDHFAGGTLERCGGDCCRSPSGGGDEGVEVLRIPLMAGQWAALLAFRFSFGCMKPVSDVRRRRSLIPLSANKRSSIRATRRDVPDLHLSGTERLEVASRSGFFRLNWERSESKMYRVP